jgi:hypothetical protein
MANENVGLMIDHIHNGRNLEAEQAFNAAISEKVGTALENLKVDVGGRLFGDRDAGGGVVTKE